MFVSHVLKTKKSSDGEISEHSTDDSSDEEYYEYFSDDSSDDSSDDDNKNDKNDKKKNKKAPNKKNKGADKKAPFEWKLAPFEWKSILIFCATPTSLKSFKAIRIVEELLEDARVKVDKNKIYFKSEDEQYHKWDCQKLNSLETFTFSKLPKIDIVISEFCPCYGPKVEPFPSILLALQRKLKLLGFYIDPMPIPEGGPCSEEQQKLAKLTWLLPPRIKKADNKGYQKFKIFRKIDEAPTPIMDALAPHSLV